MALSVKTGKFYGPSTIGLQTISGVGFTPKLVIIMSSSAIAAATLSTSPNRCRVNPVTDFVLASFCNTVGAKVNGIYFSDTSYASAPSVPFRLSEEDHLLLSQTGGYLAELSSITSDGFILNWVSTAYNAEFYYFCIGGVGISNVRTGSFLLNNSAGAQIISGVGFTPHIVLLYTVANTVFDAFEASLAFSMGAARSATERWTSGFSVKGANPEIAKRVQKTNKFLSILSPTLGTLQEELDLTSLNADGFTINISTASATPSKVFYIALNGSGSHKLGSFNLPTTIVNNPSLFTPSAILLCSNGNITSSSINAGARFSLGFGDLYNQFATWFEHGDAQTSPRMCASENIERSIFQNAITDNTRVNNLNIREGNNIIYNLSQLDNFYAANIKLKHTTQLDYTKRYLIDLDSTSLSEILYWTML